MAKWKAGIVGLHRGGGLLRALAAHPDVEIAALCDLNEDVLADVGRDHQVPEKYRFTQFHNFVNAPVDIVAIATPIEYHAQQSIAAMESGKHVLCEQTAAYTVDDCERLVQTVQRTGQVYMMAENSGYSFSASDESESYDSR